MSGREVEVVIWSPDWSERTGRAIVTRYAVEALGEVRWFRATYRPGWRGMVGSVFSATFALWRALLVKGVGTVYLVNSATTVGFLRDVPALLAACAARRVVVHCHASNIVDLLSRRHVSPLARALYRRCELIVPSSHLVAELERIGIGSVHLCENFIDLDAIDAAGHRVRDDDSRAIRVVWNSNVMASKGFFVVAEAVDIVRRRGLPIELLALGEPIGDAESSLKKTLSSLDRLRHHDWLEFRGSVPYDEALALTATADVIALPSNYVCECQPLALIQAMCLGVPVVVYDTPALRATLGDYPARLMSRRDACSLADALERLESEGELERRSDALAEGARTARTRFSLERFRRDLLAILDV